ncbi:MAG: protein kinase [Acidobacteria bacterium]|nr:protein kinase [Acidobacteriota bacterium]
MHCQCGAEQETTTNICSVCGAELNQFQIKSTDELAIGTLLADKYEVIRLLGKGGMGEVYLAKDLHLERMIAIKTLSTELAGEGEHKARFLREARMASALNHPNILTVYEVGTYKNLLFMATEYVEGQTLRQIIRVGTISLRDFLDIAIQGAQGLAAAHEAGIIHRDLKLENFILRQDGYLKVLDFGLAKEADTLTDDPTDTFKTRAGLILGTPHYMSPEQAKGKALDARSDIFSFGTVLYELLTRQVAFDADSDVQILFNVVFKEPDPISDTVPLRIREIVKRAMQKSPDTRYQSMQTLLEDLITCRTDLQNLLHLHAGTINPQQNRGTGKLIMTGINSRFTSFNAALNSTEMGPATAPDYDQFVGRDSEIGILKTELQRTYDGKSRPVLILGDSGSGKTQLLFRFQQWAQSQKAIIGITSFFDQNSNLGHPYQPVLSLLGSVLSISDTETTGGKKDSETGRKIATQIKTQFNIELPSIVFENSLQKISEVEQWQVFDALRQLFNRLTQSQPLVLLFDNLHWASNIILELIGYALRNLIGTRLLIVATASDEEASRPGAILRDWILAQSRYLTFEQIKLKPFDSNDVRKMLETIFLRIEISPQEIYRLCEITSGNPYYLIELVRLLVNENKISLGEGWWLCQSLEEIELPTTIGIAVEYKLEKCPEELKNLLAQASVIGETFNFEVLAEISEKDEDDLEKLLSIGVKTFLIKEEKSSRGDDYRFYNATIKRVLYEGLSKRQKRRLHAQVAEAIQTVYRNKISRVIGKLAYHYNAAGEWQESFEFAHRAIEQAIEQESWRDVSHYTQLMEEAVTAIEESPDDYDPIDKIVLADVKLKCSLAMLRLGNVSQAVSQAEAGLKIGQELDNHSLIARGKARLCEYGWFQGKFADAIRIGQEGLISAKISKDVVSERYINFHVGVAAWRSVPLSIALEHLSLACELAEAANDNRLLALARIFYSVVLHCQGSWQEGNLVMKKAKELAQAVGDRFAEGRSYSISSIMQYYERNHLELQETHQRGVELSRSIGWRIGEAYMHTLLGFDYLSPTNLDINQAKDYLQRGMAICLETGEKGTQILIARGLARIATLLGDYSQAITKLQEILTILRTIGDLFEQTAVLCMLGEAQEADGQLDEAINSFQECFLLTEKLHFPFWQWQALFGQAICLNQLGRNKEAITKLSLACTTIVKLRKQFSSEKEGENFINETQKVYDFLTRLNAE